eukprot:CAMPEP_0178450482 /NCGR_PEP_ID=MMETSP0689_2-20121128/43148_1 /TAXON_ID=160604 /ORGANISM="Amphidinium massartii, Strain CS-259" /LENGTH=159 /DNA_ID=CAMNT_0020075951 /DNA_START=404 /DNA_END=883 /DNA_ORIENTATION=+
MAHIDSGEPSIAAAVQAAIDEIGLKHLKAQDLEFIFQMKTELPTGGGCELKQVVDIYFAFIGVDNSSYSHAPNLEALTLDRHEVDRLKWIDIDELESAWASQQQQSLVPFGAITPPAKLSKSTAPPLGVQSQEDYLLPGPKRSSRSPQHQPLVSKARKS